MTHTKKTYPLWFYYGLITLASAIWGLGTVLIKTSVDSFPATWLVACRFGMAALVFLALFFIPIIKHSDKNTVKAGVAIGIATGCAFVFNTLGLTDTSASNSSFIMGTSVIIVPFLAWLGLHIKPTAYNIVAALLCILGIGFVAIQGAGDFVLRWGDGITVLSAIAVAFEVTITSRVASSKNLFALTFWQFVTACIVAIIWSLATQAPLPTAELFTPELIGNITYLAVAGSCVTIALQNIGLAHVDPAPGTLFLSTEIIFGVGFSILLLGEHLSYLSVVGALLICLSILVSEYLPTARWFIVYKNTLKRAAHDKVFTRPLHHHQLDQEDVAHTSPASVLD